MKLQLKYNNSRLKKKSRFKLAEKENKADD